MRFITQWRKAMHFRKLHKALKHFHVQRKPLSYQKAKNIGILFNAADKGSLDVVKRFEKALRQKGKKVKVLAYVADEKQRESYPYLSFGKKELTFALIPTGRRVENFINNPFDLLFNLYTANDLPLAYISALSKAQLRIGTATAHPFYYDLMVEVPPEKDLAYFIQQAEKILKHVNNKETALAPTT